MDPELYDRLNKMLFKQQEPVKEEKPKEYSHHKYIVSMSDQKLLEHAEEYSRVSKMWTVNKKF